MSRMMNDSSNGSVRYERRARYASRWDDLPQKTNDDSNSHRKSAFRTRIDPTNDDNTNARDQHQPRRDSNLLPILTSDRQRPCLPRNLRWQTTNSKISLNDDVLLKYRSLQADWCNILEQNKISFNSDAFDKYSCDLLQFILQHHTILPFDETSTIVHDILLPTLLLSFNEHESTQSIAAAALIGQIMKVLETLLMSKQNASAMLSPIKDQNDCNNPTRRKLWSVFQHCLPITVECFTICVQNTKRFDELLSSNSKGRQKYCDISNNIHLDLPRIMKFLNDTLAVKLSTNCLNVHDSATTFKRQEQALKLLLALLQYKPMNQAMSSSIPFIQSLLFPNYLHHNHRQQQQQQNTVMDCHYCGWHHEQTQSNFLKILHDHTELEAIALQNAAYVIQSMPLPLWLSGTRNLKPKRLSAFQLSLMDVLTDLMRAAYCKVHQQMVSLNEVGSIEGNGTALTIYIKSMLTHLPFDHSDPILSGHGGAGYEVYAYNLVDTIFYQSFSSIHDVYFPIIRECLRGHITPSGPLQTTSAPIDKWMRRNGHTFLQNTLSEAIQKVPTESVLSLLYDVLRSYPDLILMHLHQSSTKKSPWYMFQSFLKQHSSTEPIIVAKCIERLFFGRQCYMKEVMETKSTELPVVSFNELIDFMLPIFENYDTAENMSDDVQGLVYSSISYFTTEDWDMIFRLPSAHRTNLFDRILTVIQRILENCTDTSKSETLQTMCCKAIGNICPNFIPSYIGVDNRTHVESAVIMKFFLSLKRTLLQEHSISVRCMAMFATGNLSHTIAKTSTMLNIFSDEDADMFIDFTEFCLQCMSDKNEKFATNAVRTTGFMAGLVLRFQDRQNGIYKRDTVKQLLERVVSAYVANIRYSIELESSFALSKESQYSWKERMAVKKKGWGSCNSLSFLLGHDVLKKLHLIDDDTTTESVVDDDVIACLVECFESINTAHEKVVMSACVAFRSIPDLSELKNDQLVGKAMVACCQVLFDDESIEQLLQQKKKMNTEMELVLSKLVPCCTVPIVLEALKSETFASHTPHLFKWMVEHNFSPIIFQAFASALTLSGSAVDVHVEQQYMNHSRGTIQRDFLEEL